MTDTKKPTSANPVLGAVGGVLGFAGVKLLGSASWLPLFAMVILGSVFGVLRKKQGRLLNARDGAVIMILAHAIWMAAGGIFLGSFAEVGIDLGLMCAVVVGLLVWPRPIAFAFGISLTGFALVVTLPFPFDADTGILQALATHTLLRVGYLVLLTFAWIRYAKDKAVEKPATSTGVGAQSSSIALGTQANLEE
ncbi:MAG: hypothetical protein GY822_23790 [Deltaproteobacteria bacterium]|nr:hypothetical protein [Deltaproteobacteria bacterium]